MKHIKIIRAVTLCAVVWAIVLPGTASAWTVVGNTYGCVTFHKTVKKIGNKIYSTAKADCRWSATKNNIDAILMTHGIQSKAIGSYSWVEGGTAWKPGQLFIYSQKNKTCANNALAEIRNESSLKIWQRGKSRPSHYSGTIRNWRTFRTLRCAFR